MGVDLELPVFELPLAALPTERVPLHIFEQRYRTMVTHCLESESEFGIVLRTDAGARSIGCAVEVTEVLERFDDGRLNIIVTGTWRFRVLDRWDGEEFPVAIVEQIEEITGTGAGTGAAQEAFQRLLEAVGAEAEASVARLDSAYAIAGRVEMPVEAKQRLLETDSETARLELLRETLNKLSDEVKRSRRLAERARGNGHAPLDGLPPPGPEQE